MASIHSSTTGGIARLGLRRVAFLLLAVILLIGGSGLAEVSGTHAAPLYSPPPSPLKWGEFGSGDSQFKSPYGAAVDNDGNVYIADFSNDRIQKFDSDGNFLLKWGTTGSRSREFRGPMSVAVDGAGNVYVAEFGNHRIQKFDSEGNFLLKWGKKGRGTGDFNRPTGVAVDSDGNVYVSEMMGRRVQKFDSNGQFLLTWGSYAYDKSDDKFIHAFDVGVDRDGNVYVVDDQLHRVQKFDSSGNFILSWGFYGTNESEFKYPMGIEIDNVGNVYVADSGNHRIQKFDSEGNFIMKWGSLGSGAEQFKSPVEVVAAKNGNVYVTDTVLNRVQKFEFFADTTPPVLNLGGDAVVEAQGPGGAAYSFAITATDNYDPSPFVLCSPEPGSTFSLGATTVICTATDASGNFSGGSFNVTVVDTSPPKLFMKALSTLEGNTEGGAIATLPTLTASDLVDPDPEISCDYSSGFFPLGVTTVTCKAEDFSGNSSTAKFSVTIEDTTPPTISAPADIVIVTNAPGGATVDLGTAAVSDIVDPSPVITNDAPVVFPMETTIVTWTATDSSGNSASATQSVTVKPITVSIDIKPGDDPNTNNCSNEHAVLTVSILSSGEFDATSVDHKTVTFEGTVETHANRDTGEPLRHEDDVNGDGLIDLVFHFNVTGTVLTCESVEGILTGETFDGFYIQGGDSINMIEPGGSKP